jgi:glycosyltransferase involved in cell wall biosynthesis
VVCGTGEAPPSLLDLVDRFSFCSVREGVTDNELAALLGNADVFVLATKMRRAGAACGEGFGMALQEAQLAGAAVVAPAQGGSHEAFLEGITGVAPRDEGTDALAEVFSRLLSDPARLEAMGKRAATWAGEMFDPQRYSDLAVERLL